MSGYDSTNDMVVCPYDPVHKVKRNHMFKHLTKCSKNHPHIVLEICPFNSLHRFKKEDEDAHLMDCPNRAGFEKYLKGGDVNKIPVKAIVDLSEPTENWDNDCDYPSYDPKKKLENSLISTSLRCATKSEKRKFRENERERCSKLRRIFQEVGIDDNAYTREKVEFKQEPVPKLEPAEPETRSTQELLTPIVSVSKDISFSPTVAIKREIPEPKKDNETNCEANQGSNNELTKSQEIVPKVEVSSIE